MTLTVALHHITRYRYDRPVTLGPQVIRLRPAAHCRTPVPSYSLSVTPREHFLNWQQDPYGNFLARVVVPEPTRQFQIEVDLLADMISVNPFDFFLEPEAERYPFTYDSALAEELAPYLRTEPAQGRLRRWLADVPRGPLHTVELLTELNRRLSAQVEYVIRMEPGVQTPEQTLELSRGSCRDSGWLLVHILRNLGFAARFVSGYLIQLRADQESLDGPSGPSADFCDLHAWAEAYVPGAGWIGLDPTSGLLAGGGHLPLACTPQPRSAAPVTGALGECEVEFDFTMSVTRAVESARVTKPYTEAQWAAIDSMGSLVDERLRQGDVRLTMGGEPTFVSIDDMEGEEWNTAAVGPRQHPHTKAALASQLVVRLRDRFAPMGAVHFGQGKWYPGESLPRWAYGLFWREDGEPLWERRELVALTPGAVGLEQCRALADGLASRLGVGSSCVVPAYEDPWHALGEERKLPAGLDPRDVQLDDPEARARLARTFERGLKNPVGFVLPLQPWQARDLRGWRSGRWVLRTERLLLSPGDSPMGLRLPLEALPPLAPAERHTVVPRVPFERAEPLPTPRQLRVTRATSSPPDPGMPSPVRTALCVEPRDGFVYVFLPPLADAEDYVALLAAVEDTAAELSLPIRLEGYEPPPDHRLRCARVTPDPGVIEVNVAPSSSWSTLVQSTEALYDEARQCRLGTEKFMLDGRHSGTGGGNHIVLGAATPADSPFLRRPDLLRSVIGFFVNHPSLSFLFSGLFIGPTSQAPRIDEARDDALHELEIAFQQIPDGSGRDEPVFPWVVDRIFRDVLVDLTGNTHRTEICIDKLYSPDSPSGRQGLVEFRSFEMPPHARMSLAQGLMLRALVAHLWETPYTRPLQHWGTALHDRFMLPHFVWQDFEDVLAALAGHGFALDPAWFAPHFEFRFPSLGSIEYRGVTLELRAALEPWHVTGEEGIIGGTARYVDSSLERVQVRVTGLADARYVVACNGRPVPLQPTGTTGEYVAGVRFRAWQPPRCLHPTIGVHVPLVFDLVDTWSGRSVAGCTYHVGHPGGRNYERFPLNALEAEGRRLARFSALRHSGGPLEVPPESPSRAFPFTLDLRAAPRRWP